MSATGVDYAKLGRLREALAEAARTDETNAARTVERFVELRPGHEDTLKSRQHHLISGRRGTGKSTLLHVARAHLRESGAPVAVIDMEKFKNRPYPDVLIEILISLLDELRPKLRLKSLIVDVRLRRKFMSTRRELDQMLRDPQAWSRQMSRSKSKSGVIGGGLKTRAGKGPVEAGVEASGTAAGEETMRETAAFEVQKIRALAAIGESVLRGTVTACEQLGR